MAKISKPRAQGLPKRKPDTCELNYMMLGDKQEEFHASWRKSIRIACGAFATGKTILAVGDLLFHLLNNPEFYGAKALVVAVTGGHIKTQLWPVFESLLTNWDEKNKVNKGYVEGRHYKLSKAPAWMLEFNKECNGGPTIVFASAESETNLRGHSVDIVMVDDLSTTLTEQVWNIVQTRAFRNPRFEGDKRGFVLATCNPGNPATSWVYKRYFHHIEENTVLTDEDGTILRDERGLKKFVKPIPDDIHLERFELFDNPKMKEQWPTYVAMYEHDPIGYQRDILGHWVGVEGLVYPNFNESKHVIEYKSNLGEAQWDVEFDKPYYSNAYEFDNNEINGGLDFGQNTACLFVMKKYFDSFKGGTEPVYIIFDEYYNNNPSFTVKRHASAIKEKGYGVRKFYSDHYSETVQSYNENGIRCTLADKSKGAKEQGIDLINRLFYENRLFVHKRCKNFIREIQGYVYKKPDITADINDHCMDAGRYVLYAIAGKGATASFTLPNVVEKIKLESTLGPRVIVDDKPVPPGPQVVQEEFGYRLSFKHGLDGWG